MSTLIAQHDRIIMKPFESQEKLYGRIVVPDTGGERSNMYVVIATGPGLYNAQFDKCNPVSVKVGDVVIVPKGLVYNIVVEGEEYNITRDNEIQAIIID